MELKIGPQLAAAALPACGRSVGAGGAGGCVRVSAGRAASGTGHGARTILAQSSLHSTGLYSLPSSQSEAAGPEATGQTTESLTCHNLPGPRSAQGAQCVVHPVCATHLPQSTGCGVYTPRPGQYDP